MLELRMTKDSLNQMEIRCWKREFFPALDFKMPSAIVCNRNSNSTMTGNGGIARGRAKTFCTSGLGLNPGLKIACLDSKSHSLFPGHWPF